MSFEGVLPVWKPVDFTSHDVVAKVRGILGVKRIGHTGTLDPKVTGVLPLCIGRATRVVEYIQDLPKQYEATLTVGYATDTEDATGQVIAEAERVEITAEQAERVIRSFVGVISQVPPMYSAVKVDGKRLYELARLGKEVERKARNVEIYGINLLSMDLDRRHPEIRFRVDCSKGTYIRTLCADIGQALGYPAVMSDLVRTATGSMTKENCLTLEDIGRLVKEGQLQSKLIDTAAAIPHVPALSVTDKEAADALQGKKIRPAAPPAEVPDDRLFRLFAPDGTFLGIFRFEPDAAVLRPEKVFSEAR
ncbi:tRNA pseudouridine(55) synthase TruB [Paenibacillus contaminans]|uniref:tRNA pseudouridine synthase B n=1 Tax=Paenibacillus contaminans TaxID=450362 RepID=A0A329MW33_9BACL|nr:tRNA pseudouridine(55) synthase TruB [Paenibacillus contaminans]RAV22753.1 tRNA pseudouridine(55) synthase TruB [Paenibacillus contaminans]